MLFLSFLKLKISMKLEKIRIFILQFDLGKPRSNEKLLFQDANFLTAALTLRARLHGTRSEFKRV